MKTVTVIGSGASGVHFALTLLKKGAAVTLIDVGRQGRPAVLPNATLTDLKEQLDDPAEYFLGKSFEAVLLPGPGQEYYGIPPSKNFVFEQPSGFGVESSQFAPLFSFARGGLGEVWTGGCYPMTADEIADYPFAHADLAGAYSEVARRIGITGEADDLSRFMPLHDHLQPPLKLDPHSQRLMASYGRKRARLNSAGAYLGRTRVATLSQRLGAREACNYTGRCLWGCPRGSLYTPSHTLLECQGYPNFRYVSGVEVLDIGVGPGARVQAVNGRETDTGRPVEFRAEHVALAAGALMSTRIFLTTMERQAGQRLRLQGLMDNRQVLVPFVNLGMIGRPFSSDTYQYHLLGMGLETDQPRDYVHGQITTLKTALTHPLIQRIPFGLSASTRMFRALHASLGLVNVNFRDTRRDSSYVELDPDDPLKLRIHYEPDRDEPDRIASALQRVRSTLWALNCVVPPGVMHVRPMGASVHYAGTVPMTRAALPLTTDSNGKSRDIDGLYLVDGATFPFLPAKNLTFTLMANAVRIAEAAFF